MAENNSIINLGDLSKPATILIEKVCNAVGIIYEPTQIKRKARAEIEVEKMKAIAQRELTAIENRAIERLIYQESRKQENIESITTETARALPISAKVQDLDEDWLSHFFKQCDTVSDKEMQTLWASLLTKEATSPGVFSKRTVDFISSIDKKDALLFTRFCQFVWEIDGIDPLIYDLNHEIYKVQKITFDALKHLDAIGLISFEAVSKYEIFEDADNPFQAIYYGSQVKIERHKNPIEVGHAIFTEVGRQLFSICGSVRNEQFYEYVIDRWFRQGFILSSTI